MTKLWLDTEFNGFGGEFISAALVGEVGEIWYQTIACKNPVPWVAENVIPVIGIKAITLAALQKSLQIFLSKFKHVTIVADWPTDIEHFCRLLCLQPFDGRIMDTPAITFELKTWLNCGAQSEVPHNALADARAMMQHDLATDHEAYKLSDAEFARLPGSGRPLGSGSKIQVTLQLDSDVVEKLKTGGIGWQTRANAVLRKSVMRSSKSSLAAKV